MSFLEGRGLAAAESAGCDKNIFLPQMLAQPYQYKSHQTGAIMQEKSGKYSLTI